MITMSKEGEAADDEVFAMVKGAYLEKTGYVTADELKPYTPSYRLGEFYGNKFKQEGYSLEEARIALVLSATEYADEAELERGFLDGYQAPLVTASAVSETGRRGGREA